MILKIGRAPDGAKPPILSRVSWRFIENVRDFEYSPEKFNPDEEDGKHYSMTLSYYIDDVFHSTELIGNEFCYLMNDEGKTIERIR